MSKILILPAKLCFHSGLEYLSLIQVDNPGQQKEYDDFFYLGASIKDVGIFQGGGSQISMLQDIRR